MAVQASAKSSLAIKPQPTKGVLPGATGSQFLRRVTSALAVRKGTFSSNEVRQDQQVSDLRHGGRTVGGSVDGELSIETYDALLEAALRGTWAAGVSASPTQFATGITLAAAGENTAVTFAGSGNLLTLGFRIGDVVRFTGSLNAALNGKNLRIVALTATVMTVAGAGALTQAQQAAGWTVAVAGRKLLMGSVDRYFAFEQRHPDAAAYETFRDCRINGFNLNVPPNGMVTCGFDVMGLEGTAAATPYFTSPAAETNTPIVSGVDGALRFAGKDRGIVTGFQCQMTNSMSAPPVVGSQVSPEIFQGRMVVTGSVTAFLEDVSLINAFLNEEEVDLTVIMEASGADPQDFISLSMQRVKLSDGSKSIGPDGGVIVNFPFQALLASGAGRDVSTLVMQRSNV